MTELGQHIIFVREIYSSFFLDIFNVVFVLYYSFISKNDYMMLWLIMQDTKTKLYKKLIDFRGTANELSTRVLDCIKVSKAQALDSCSLFFSNSSF